MSSLVPIERPSALAPVQSHRFTFGGAPITLSEAAPVAVADDIRRIFAPTAPVMSPLVRRESYTETTPGFWGNRFETRQRQVTRSSPDLFQEFSTKHRLVDQLREQALEWCRTAVAANVEFRGVDGPTQQGQLLGGRVQLLQPLTEPLPWRSPVELAVKPLPEQLEGLTQWLQDAYYGVAESMAKTLDGFCGQEMLGRLVRHENRVCELIYYRWKVEESVVGVRRGPETRRTENVTNSFVREVTTVHGQKDLRRELKHQFHHHILQDAEFLPWDTSRVPARFRPVLQKTPPAWRSLVEIVVGNEIGRRVLERDVFSETFTEDFTEERSHVFHRPVVQRPVYVPRDPGIVFARSIVLCGWSPEEV